MLPLNVCNHIPVCALSSRCSLEDPHPIGLLTLSQTFFLSDSKKVGYHGENSSHNMYKLDHYDHDLIYCVACLLV